MWACANKQVNNKLQLHSHCIGYDGEISNDFGEIRRIWLILYVTRVLVGKSNYSNVHILNIDYDVKIAISDQMISFS